MKGREAGVALGVAPTVAELAADMPKTAPVRILDERGHLRTLEDIERDLIQLAIEIYAGHMSEVARRLGIGRSTLYRKVREQGLEDQVREAGLEPSLPLVGRDSRREASAGWGSLKLQRSPSTPAGGFTHPHPSDAARRPPSPRGGGTRRPAPRSPP